MELEDITEVPFPRRVLLGGGLLTGIWCALGVLDILMPRTAAAAPALSPGGAPLALRALSSREFATLKTIVAVMIDDGGAVTPSVQGNAADSLDQASSLVARRIDRELWYWTPYNRDQFKLLLGLFEDWTLLLGAKFGPFTAMSRPNQISYLAGWATSGWDLKRQGYVTLKTLVAFFYYTLDETWKRIGYDGPWVASAPLSLE